jgi:lipopolysaccharide/colanic/teichoic acid biosynthesis glycosyltransferase
VLIGDMSLVGPRPEREHFVNELKRESPFYEQRFVVRPGLTGWAQINAEYADTKEETLEKLKLDLYYVKNMSVLLDLSIMASTIRIVLLGKGGR